MFSTFVKRALAGELPAMAALQPDWSHCTNKGCSDPIVAEILVGQEWMGKCFTHERENADRYGVGESRRVMRR